MYKPNPIDTSDVVLTDEIIDIIEILSRNTHEVWAEQKLKDGWTYAKTTNADKRTHSCIKEYDKLSEEEIMYDKNTVTEAIKVLLKMGYKITK